MERKGRVMYSGKWINSTNQVRFKYIVVKQDNSLGKEWNFKSAIFRKGTIGSIFHCSFEDSSIIYSKNEIPTSFVEINGKLVDTFIQYPELRKYEEEHRQAEVVIRNSKKQTSPLDEEVKFMKATYKQLPPQKRASFIGNLVYRITS